MNVILLLLALLVLGTILTTLAFYLCWYYDRRSFPEQAVLPGEEPLRPLSVVLGIVKEAAALTLLVAAPSGFRRKGSCSHPV